MMYLIKYYSLIDFRVESARRIHSREINSAFIQTKQTNEQCARPISTIFPLCIRRKNFPITFSFILLITRDSSKLVWVISERREK